MSILSQSAPDRMLSPAHLPQNILLPSTKHSIKSKFKLPPAVVNVPPDHIRGYVHTKKVDSYLVGNTLGEGSFAKVKEAFHVLVGEKVCCSYMHHIVHSEKRERGRGIDSSKAV